MYLYEKLFLSLLLIFFRCYLILAYTNWTSPGISQSNLILYTKMPNLILLPTRILKINFHILIN